MHTMKVHCQNHRNEYNQTTNMNDNQLSSMRYTNNHIEYTNQSVCLPGSRIKEQQMTNLEKFESFEGYPLDVLKAYWEVIRPYDGWKNPIMTVIPAESFSEFDTAVQFFTSTDLQILCEIDNDGEKCMFVFSEGFSYHERHGRLTMRQLT